jgi:chitodextrinase
LSRFIVSDITAPTVPTDLVATPTGSTLVLTWTASTDANGVASYRVRRDGVDLPGAEAVTGTTFTDTTVSPGVSYTYTVSAVDAAGNRSAESASDSASISALTAGLKQYAIVGGVKKLLTTRRA